MKKSKSYVVESDTDTDIYLWTVFFVQLITQARIYQDCFQEEGDSGLLPTTIQEKFEGDFLLQYFL